MVHWALFWLVLYMMQIFSPSAMGVMSLAVSIIRSAGMVLEVPVARKSGLTLSQSGMILE